MDAPAGWRRRGRIVAGFVAPLALCFVALAILWNVSVWLSELSLLRSSYWAFIASVWLLGLPLLGVGMGVLSALVWHPLLVRDSALQMDKWGEKIVVIAHIPTVLVCCIPAVVTVPLLLFSFSFGLDYGLRFWPRQGWRTLIGARNEWERPEE